MSALDQSTGKDLRSVKPQILSPDNLLFEGHSET